MTKQTIEEDKSALTVPFAIALEDIEFIESLGFTDSPWAHLFENANDGFGIEYGFATWSAVRMRKAKTKEAAREITDSCSKASGAVNRPRI